MSATSLITPSPPRRHNERVGDSSQPGTLARSRRAQPVSYQALPILACLILACLTAAGAEETARAQTHAAPAHTVVRRPPPVDRSALPTIDYVNATYGRYGRAIRVDWSSTAQAAADVQLTDARGTLIGERAVGAGRSYVVMGLPRGYHGGIFVQVSVTGYHSERVVQTSSLTPF